MSGRHVLTMNLKGDPGIVESYIRLHRDVWPEVQASLRHAGVERMDIYLLGRRLVMVVEMRDGLDYRTACRRGACGRMVGRHGAGLSSESGCSGGAGHCPPRRSVAHVLSPGR
jgi:hypothetical protein